VSDVVQIESFDSARHSIWVGPLTELLHEAYRVLDLKGLRYLASHQPPERTLERLTRGEAYLAFWDGNLAGTISLDFSKSDSPCEYYRRPGLAHFGQFAVKPAFQGRGIARRLLQHVERRAGELGFSEIALDTAEGALRLIAMYQRHGYIVVSSTRWASTNYLSVVMAKDI
jgi:GNAT superfamily N-acetyltransferase